MGVTLLGPQHEIGGQDEGPHENDDATVRGAIDYKYRMLIPEAPGGSSLNHGIAERRHWR